MGNRMNRILFMFCALLACIATGCASGGTKPTAVWPGQSARTPVKLRQIESIALEHHSSIPPVTIEDASKDEPRVAVAANSIDLTIDQVRAAVLSNPEVRINRMDPGIARERAGADGPWRVESIRIGELRYTLANAQTKRRIVRAIAESDRVYWSLHGAIRELAVRHRDLELARQQMVRARTKVESGIAVALEVARAEAGVAERQESVVIAQARVRRLDRQLKRMLNRSDLKMKSATAIAPVTDPIVLGYQLSSMQLTKMATANRTEEREQELRMSIALLNVAIARKVATNDADPRVQLALLQHQQRRIAKKRAEEQIKQDVLDAIDRLHRDWNRILLARKSVMLTNRRYLAEKRQFELNLRTSTDVLEAASLLAEAQLREVRAVADYQISQVDLAFATGSVLGEHRVNWSPIEIDQVTGG